MHPERMITDSSQGVQKDTQDDRKKKRKELRAKAEGQSGEEEANEPCVIQHPNAASCIRGRGGEEARCYGVGRCSEQQLLWVWEEERISGARGQEKYEGDGEVKVEKQ